MTTVVVLFALPILFIPGFVLLVAVAPRFRSAELVVAAPGVTCLILGIAQFLSLAFRPESRSLFAAAVLFMTTLIAASGAWRVVWARMVELRRDRAFGIAFGVYLLFALGLIVRSLLTPHYGGGHWQGDWWWHWELARKWASIVKPKVILVGRTPLFNFVQAFFVGPREAAFWEFQLTNAILESLFMLPAFLLARRLVGERGALVFVAVLLVNPWAVQMSWYTWPKIFTAYFVLVAAHFAVRAREAPDDRTTYLCAAGLFGGGAYLAHPLAASYVPGLLAYLVLSGRGTLRLAARIRDAMVVGAWIAALAVPWHAWTLNTFGWTRLKEASPAFAFNLRGADAEPVSGALARLHNVVYTIVPNEFALFSAKGDDALDCFLIFHFNSLLGCLTLSGAVGLIIVSIRYLIKRRRTTTGITGPGLWAAVPVGGLAALFVLLLLSLYLLSGTPEAERTLTQAFNNYSAANRLRLVTIAVWLLCLTVCVTARLAWQRVWIPDEPGHLASLLLLTTGFIGGVVLHPGPDKGVLHQTMAPSGVLFLLYCWKALSHLRRTGFALVMAGCVIEGLFTIWGFSWFVRTGRIAVTPVNIALESSQGLKMLVATAIGRSDTLVLALAGLHAAASVALLAWFIYRYASSTQTPAAEPK